MNMTLQIEAVYQRALLLRQRATEFPVQSVLLNEALQELALVLEELQASEEEVRRQNQRLIETQQQVEIERNQYKDLFNHAPDGYLVTDKTGVIRGANLAIASMLNVSQSYLIGKPFLLFVADAARSTFYRMLDQLNQQTSGNPPQPHDWEIQICPRQENTSLDVAITLSIVFNPESNGSRYRWLLRDVTQKKQVALLLEQLNTKLEHQVRERTAQLQQALNFESSLKRITDKVRDSLDEAQIMQTVVQELVDTLEVSCCNASHYDMEQDAAVICYEHTHLKQSYKNRIIRISSNPAIYRQILQHRVIQYCPIPPDPEQGKLVMMATPILDDQGVLGDLWLIDQNSNLTFSEQDIRLVQQVANQCAIAIRQARLYQASQQQVHELEELHLLKDTFLSTVSHELRTPLSNMNMAIRMLSLVINQTDQFTDAQPRLVHYLEILETQCRQEISLVNDLLDLNRLDVNAGDLELTTVDLNPWLSHIIASFEGRIRNQQQHLQINIAPNLPPLTTDASLLQRIVTELLNNACKYTPPQEAIAITATKLDQSLHLSISNSGVDLPPHALGRLFETFYRVPSHDPWKHGGTGLGLALVKKQVAKLGGAIVVTNVQGWITFTLEVSWETHPVILDIPE